MGGHFTNTSPALPMFAGIFAIGLFFAVLFWRSGNLWMVGLFHGIGNMYIEGTPHAFAARSLAPSLALSLLLQRPINRPLRRPIRRQCL